MNLGLEDRIAVVTGGSSGIGLAVVRSLLADGAHVLACARDQERLAGAAAAIERDGLGARLVTQRCDVLDAGDVDALAQRAAGLFGRVDILINNAGQARISTFAETSDDDWTAELHLKFFSVVRPTRAFLPLLRSSEAASVVIVNSLLARQPEPHMVCTSAARAGVQSLAKSLSVELAPDVRVNTILLGTVASSQWERRYDAQPDRSESYDQWLDRQARHRGIPIGRMGTAQEAANAIVFLSSPAAGFITGAALEVAGGVSRFS